MQTVATNPQPIVLCSLVVTPGYKVIFLQFCNFSLGTSEKRDGCIHVFSSVPWKRKVNCTMLFRDKGLQSSLQKIVTFMFQALVLVHNIVTSVWYIYFCCTALCYLLLSFYSIVTHSKAENCHFDVSCTYREAKYLHFLPVFDDLIKGT